MSTISQNQCNPSLDELASFILRMKSTDPQKLPRPGFCAFCGTKLESEEEASFCPRYMCDHIASNQKLYEMAIVRSKVGLVSNLWKRECPELFQKMLEIANNPEDRSLAKRMDWKTYDEVMRWFPSHNGKMHILCRGESGAGKTTSMWHKFKYLADYGKGFDVLTASELPSRLSGRDGMNNRADIERRLKTVPILGIDDFGKEAMSQTMEAILFDIIEYRLANHKTMIITTRYSSVEIHSRFHDKSKSTDITRRFNDYFKMPIFRDQSLIESNKQEVIEI